MLTILTAIHSYLSERKQRTKINYSFSKWHYITVEDPGADPEGSFGDLSPLNFLEVKIIKNVNGKLMGKND